MMRGIILTVMAFLVMTSVTFAVSLDYIITHDSGADGTPEAGFRTAVVRATGIGINTLAEFTVTGNVNQVWNYGATEYVMSEWVYNIDGMTPADPLDSQVLFGVPGTGTCDREADLPNQTGTPWGSRVTSETNTGTDPGNPALPLVGLGTINNSGSTSDAYVVYGTPGDTEETVDLLQLVIPDGETVTVALTLFTAELNTSTGFYTDVTEYNFGTTATTTPNVAGDALTIYSFSGDCDMDGDSDGVDLVLFGKGYFGEEPPAWGTGDFDGIDGVNGVDLVLFGKGYFGEIGPGTGAEATAVPEPGTIIMLVLGTLCLAGYRLRK